MAEEGNIETYENLRRVDRCLRNNGEFIYPSIQGRACAYGRRLPCVYQGERKGDAYMCSSTLGELITPVVKAVVQVGEDGIHTLVLEGAVAPRTDTNPTEL
jgi:hypothetical protein